MIILDTTVLVYAVGADHPLRTPCARLLEAVGTQQVIAGTTPEVIQEFCHIRARRRARREAGGLAADLAHALSPLLLVEESGLSAGLELFASISTLGCFDAVLAAVAIDVGAEALVSADRGFAGLPGLTHVFPDERGVTELLAGRSAS